MKQFYTGLPSRSRKKSGPQFVFSTTHAILLSFMGAILLGSLLLALPVSSARGRPLPYIDALFTATTSVCVTGLVTVPTVSAWSPFGQTVILLLIQIGGLGIITIMSGFMIGLGQKLDMGDRALLQDAFNLRTASGLVRFVKKVLAGTFLVEALGALAYMPILVPEYGPRGIWMSIFLSISAFCNAGMDIMATDSLCRYAQNPLINITTCALIFLGGMGYIVWWDVLRVLGLPRQGRGPSLFRRLHLQSQIALWTSFWLLAAGTAAYLLFEYNNPLTMAGLPWWERLPLAIFQSFTTRTAGFATLPQEHLTNASALFSLFLMFVGGSPSGTAGGVKTVTLTVLVCAGLAALRNAPDSGIFRKSIPREAVGKAISIVGMSFLIAFGSTLLLSMASPAPALDIAYESFSATATVGLSRSLTPSLDVWGKAILVGTMYLGRVGPISLAVALHLRRENPALVKNPVEQIRVG